MHVFIQEDSEILIPTLRVVKAGEAAFSPAEYDTGYTIRHTTRAARCMDEVTHKANMYG